MAADNMQNPAVDPSTEDEVFAREVDQVKKWWSDPRWRQTKRPFTAEQIVSKRGNLKIEYPSNTQAKKLWRILEKRFQVSHPPTHLHIQLQGRNNANRTGIG
jgi:isocitrate/methylisocitrate lyase